MRRPWLIPILILAFLALLVPVAVLAGSGEDEFEGVVHSIESRYHAHATRIPFMGLVSAVSRKATQGGVGGLKIAEFESFSEPVDGAELNRMVEQKLGPGWERIVRETSRKPGSPATGLGRWRDNENEQTFIFIHPEGECMGLFVLDLDGRELDVVQVSVDPAHLNENLGNYGHHHSESDRQAKEPD